MGMHVMRRLTSRAGTAAGVVALQSQEDYEAVFRATREHLTEASSVSIARNQIRAQRRALGEARRMRRALVPLQRAGAAGAGLVLPFINPCTRPCDTMLLNLCRHLQRCHRKLSHCHA